MFSLKARNKGLHLHFTRAAEVPQTIAGDEVKLRQVLINLLNNAIKFTEVGEVTLCVKAKGEGQRTTGEGQTEDSLHASPRSLSEVEGLLYHLQFSIADTGPGISPQDQSQLFQAFHQTQLGKQMQEGTGLGLTISQKFVQLMGGDIAIDSHVGEGAAFSFELPVRVIEFPQEHALQVPRRVVALASDQPQYKLLVVDDHAESRLLLVKLLAGIGFDVREAMSGRGGYRNMAQLVP